MSGPLLHYRAGPTARRILEDQGLTPETITAFVGPASGPRWLVLEALDRVLLEAGLLPQGLLVGSSAGAWRALALASEDPATTYRRLLEGYVGQVFPKGVPPHKVSTAYRHLLSSLFAHQSAHLMGQPLAIHTVRLRRGRSPTALKIALFTAALLSPFLRRVGELFFERVLFDTLPQKLPHPFDGQRVPLTEQNLIHAALASGTVPIYLEGVEDPPGAPEGVYFDGGLLDYHLRHPWAGDGDGIVLFPHYQRTLSPCWLDRFALLRRKPSRHALDHLFQIHPGRALLDRLPDGRPPDRNDFLRFAEQPEVRIGRWRRALELSEEAGERLRQDLESGDLVDQLETLDP